MSIRQPATALLVGFLVAAFTSMARAAGDAGWTPLLDGKSLDGWRANQSPASFKVVQGAIVVHGPRAHLFYVGDGKQPADFKNFELEAEVMTRPDTNSGIFFHTAFQDDGWPQQGFEVQVDGSQKAHGDYLELKKTGSLYGVRNIYKTMHADNEWFQLQITVRGKHVQVRLNDTLLVDYVEPDMPGAGRYRRLSHGTFALQSHDAGSEALFRNIRVKRLPDDAAGSAESPAFDDVAQQLLKLAGDNFPIVDFHTHLKGGLTVEEVLAHMYRTGINHGIAINGGIGFPITDDAGIEQFRQSMQGTPCYIALQAEGREWPTLFSPQAIAKFDYVFTDAMTLSLDGKRTRLWIKDEVHIADKQAFMEQLVATIVKILNDEPIDIYVNPTYLPEVLAAEYDKLWTRERMDRVIAAAVKNGVAVEINSRLKLPSKTFIERAKVAGVKFTFGTNNSDKELGRLEYSLQMAQECGLTWKDMWMPKPDGKKPVQVRKLAGGDTSSGSRRMGR